MNIKELLLVFCFIFSVSVYGQKNTFEERFPVVEGRWSVEKINEWYKKQPWLVGVNYYPATAINQIEMWQSSTWNPERIDMELGWAEDIGFNTLRVYLHNLVWESDEIGFYSRMDQFLDICKKHGIRPSFVFFDDCHFPNPKLGNQPLPVKAYHNSGWVNCPARDLALRYAHGKVSGEEINKLKRYVQNTMKRFKDDSRILYWELYNEPGRGKGESGNMRNIDGSSSSLGDLSNRLVYDSWVWAREVNPSQPITSNSLGSVGKNNIRINRMNSDLHSIHCYYTPERLEKTIVEYQSDGRPVVVTEWLARTLGSNVESSLPIMKKYNVAAISWGFVQGKSQTNWSWASRKKKDGKTTRDVIEERKNGNVVYPGDSYPEPELWFHDLLRIDGTPYKKEEIDVFKKLIK